MNHSKVCSLAADGGILMEADMPTLDYSKLPPAALLRVGEIVRPHGPVPLSRTAWYEAVAAGAAPPPVLRRPRMTVWRWQDVLDYLERLAGAGDPPARRRELAAPAGGEHSVDMQPRG